MNWRAHSLYFAWILALGGFLVSVYFGEVLHQEPCRLCWYQRIAIFPLALFLGIAAYRHERRLALYCLPLALFGLAAAFYQAMSKLVPSLHSPFLCGATQCNITGVSPYFSFLGFALICFFILVKEKSNPSC